MRFNARVISKSPFSGEEKEEYKRKLRSKSYVNKMAEQVTPALIHQKKKKAVIHESKELLKSSGVQLRSCKNTVANPKNNHT